MRDGGKRQWRGLEAWRTSIGGKGAMEHEERRQEARGSAQKAGAKYRAQEAGRKQAAMALLTSTRAFKPHPTPATFFEGFSGRVAMRKGSVSERWGEV